VTQVENKQRASWSIADSEAQLARARLLFDEGLREATVVGGRAARRLLVPALWGLALLGGGLALLAISRLARRRPADAALVKVVIQPRWSGVGLLPAVGGGLMRFAAQRWLAAHEGSAVAELGEPELDRRRLGSPLGRQANDEVMPKGHTRLDSRGVAHESTANGQLKTIG
jgi:hypothetical protein